MVDEKGERKKKQIVYLRLFNTQKEKRSREMKWLKKLNLPHLVLVMSILFSISSLSEQIPVSYCGNIKIEEPFFHQNSSLLSRIILCKSKQLYLRTTIGLFQIHSIDYTTKHIILSHTSCSSTSNFISPHRLSAGFPPPSTPNSLILFNCSNRTSEAPLVPCNNTTLPRGSFCGSSCWAADAEKLERSFDPKKMDCTHYRRVYAGGSEMGTRISFDIPDHVPNPCDECGKRDGNCGVALRCACHPIQCKDKVRGAAVRASGNMLVSQAFFVVVTIFLLGF